MFIASIFIIAKSSKQLKCPSTEEWLGRWMDLENILSEVTQSQKTTQWYVLTGKCVLGKECGISTIQLTNHMRLKRKKDQSVDVSVLLRRGNKIIKGSTGCEAFGRKRRVEEGKNQVWKEMEEMYRGSGN